MAAVHRYAFELWNRLNDKAEDNIFRGRLLDVWASIGASQTYYSRIRGYLIQNGYMEILEQGSRGRETVIALHKQPPADVALAPPAEREPGKRNTADPLTDSEMFATLSQKVEAIGERIGGINISEALLNFETRLAKVERQLTNANGSKIDAEVT